MESAPNEVTMDTGTGRKHLEGRGGAKVHGHLIHILYLRATPKRAKIHVMHIDLFANRERYGTLYYAKK